MSFSHLPAPAELANFGHRLEDPDLVVDGHDADEGGVGPHTLL